MPMLMLGLFGRRAIASKDAVTRILFWREDLDLSQMRLEMSFAYLGLKDADLAQRAGKLTRRNFIGGEEPVELLLLRDEHST